MVVIGAQSRVALVKALCASVASTVMAGLDASRGDPGFLADILFPLTVWLGKQPGQTQVTR